MKSSFRQSLDWVQEVLFFWNSLFVVFCSQRLHSARLLDFQAGIFSIANFGEIEWRKSLMAEPVKDL
jgi:hypothetical protein